MRKGFFRTLMIAVPLGACAAPQGPFPSLQTRAAEAIDPRVPVTGPVNDRPVSADLDRRLRALVAQARAGEAAFAPLAERAEQLAASAGAPQSESWTVAQEALSAAVAARGPTTSALGDIDALASDALQTQGGMAPADLAAVQRAGSQVSEIDRQQAARVDAIQLRLAL